MAFVLMASVRCVITGRCAWSQFMMEIANSRVYLIVKIKMWLLMIKKMRISTLTFTTIFTFFAVELKVHELDLMFLLNVILHYFEFILSI